jgi:hypothetical protein
VRLHDVYADIKFKISRFYPTLFYLITSATWNANVNSFYAHHLPLIAAYTSRCGEAGLKKAVVYSVILQHMKQFCIFMSFWTENILKFSY